MDKALVEMLVDPVDGSALTLMCNKVAGASVIEGELQNGQTKESYPIRNGIPRFTHVEDEGQKQTRESFGYKWSQRDSYESKEMLARTSQWLLKRYGFQDAGEMRAYFAEKDAVLDAGCGSGLSASVWLNESWQGRKWVGADISDAVDVAQDRLGKISNTHFIQSDLMQLPFRKGSFDAVFSEGVLHHTPSTELAIKRLSGHVKSGGEFLFYVYRRKAPLREFADDHVREALSRMEPEAAWEALRPLTRLGESLANLRAKIEIPEDISVLGIKAGTYDVQRLVYWNIAKVFWDPTISFEANHHINFDWYHPRYAQRQTEEEVRRWCSEAGLAINALDTEESGFTVRAIKA